MALAPKGTLHKILSSIPMISTPRLEVPSTTAAFRRQNPQAGPEIGDVYSARKIRPGIQQWRLCSLGADRFATLYSHRNSTE
jgi:hypothetical protein